MSKRLIGGLAVAAALLVAAPAWSHGGPPHGKAYGHWKHGKHWDNHPVHGRPVHRHYVVREVVRPVPVYPRAYYPAVAAPAPGIHVVIPSLYIPFH